MDVLANRSIIVILKQNRISYESLKLDSLSLQGALKK